MADDFATACFEPIYRAMQLDDLYATQFFSFIRGRMRVASIWDVRRGNSRVLENPESRFVLTRISCRGKLSNQIVVRRDDDGTQ